MRALTLNEKIGIKSKLAKKGLSGLAGLTMKQALFHWSMCYGKPISMWNTKAIAHRRRYNYGYD